MNAELPSWASRTAALALLGALLAAAWFAIAAPMLAAHAETDRAIAETRAMLTRYERIAAMRPGITAQIEELRRRQEAQHHYLAGDTDALAAAALQDRLQSIVQDNGGRLERIQVLPGDVEGTVRREAVRLQMTVTTEELYRILYDIRAGTPLLFETGMLVRSRLRLDRNGAEQSADPSLLVTLDVAAYRLPEVK